MPKYEEEGPPFYFKRAISILTLVVAVSFVMLPWPALASPPPDVHLYKNIIKRVENGEPYHRAAISEQRKSDFPVRPFVTVRPPLLAWLYARLGGQFMWYTGIVLLAATCMAWWASFGRWRGIPALGLAFAGGYTALSADILYIHELWSGILLSLALALYRRDRWLLTIAVATAAVCIRELAAPFLFAGAFLSRGVEQRTWIAAIAAFAAYLGWHAWNVISFVTSNDLASQGWFGFIGPRMVLDYIGQLTLLHGLPLWAIALCILGWACSRERLGAAWVLGYFLVLCIVPRPDNFFWALMVAPVAPLGLMAMVNWSAELLILSAASRNSPPTRKSGEVETR